LVGTSTYQQSKAVANDAHLNVSSEKPAFAQSRFGEAGCNVAFPKRLR
jgi:hypothetical protein